MGSLHWIYSQSADDFVQPFESMREVGTASLNDIVNTAVRKMEDTQKQTQQRINDLLKNTNQNPTEFIDRNLQIIYKQCIHKYRSICQETEKLLRHQANMMQGDMENFYKTLPVKDPEVTTAKDESMKLITVAVNDLLSDIKRHEKEFEKQQEVFYKQCKKSNEKSPNDTDKLK